MFKYLIKRLLFALIGFCLIVFTCFILVKIATIKPQKPPLMSPVTWENLCEKEGYDKPVLEQFFAWSKKIFRGDFGFSIKKNQKVFDIVYSKIPLTIKMNIIPTLLSIPLGIMFAIIAVKKKNSFVDHAINLFSIIILTLGTLIISILAQYFLVHLIHCFPYQVATPAEWEEKGFWFGVYSYLLPLLIMTLLNMVFYIRRIRGELIEQTSKDYFLLARSKGLSFNQSIYRHGLKNALVPYAPLLFAEIAGLITGSFLIEKIFSIDGTGSLLIESFSSQDQPLLMFCFSFFTFVGLITNICGDLSYLLLDPRMKIGSTKNETD